MKTITLIIDGKEIEAQVNEEDLKEVEKKREFRRSKKGESYFFINPYLEPRVDIDFFDKGDRKIFNSGNYFLTEKECADAARVVSLWLRMKRFADEYNKETLKFSDCCRKYFVVYDFSSEVLQIDWRYSCQDMFQIYFDSKETAQKAIDKFHDELMWYFIEYRKDNKKKLLQLKRYSMK